MSRLARISDSASAAPAVMENAMQKQAQRRKAKIRLSAFFMVLSFLVCFLRSYDKAFFFLLSDGLPLPNMENHMPESIPEFSLG